MLADGTIVNAGGKVVKNVAGYDLGKLVCGSRGRLAFIGRVSLRLHPAPVAAATVVVETDDTAAVAATLLASQLVPSALDVLHPGRVAVLFEGGAAAVAAQVEATRSLVGGAEADAAVWVESRTRQAAALGRASFAPGALRAFLERVPEAVVRPAAGIAFISRPPCPTRRRAGAPAPGAGARALRPAGRARVSAAPDVLRSLTSDCVHCGFCLPTCPTYLLWSEEMDSPRGRIQLMESHLDGTISLNPTVVGHFDLCLGCMACVTACPSGVQYDSLIEATRETIETDTRRPFGDRFVRGALFKLLPYPRRMGPALRLAPLGRKLPLPGTARRDDRDRAAVALDREAGTKYARAWRDARTCRHSHRLRAVRGVRFRQRRDGAGARGRRLRGRRAAAGLLRCPLDARGTRRRGSRLRPPCDRGVRRRRDGDREHRPAAART